MGNADIISDKLFDLPVAEINKWYTSTIENSNMTPEQKGAVLDYLKSGLHVKQVNQRLGEKKAEREAQIADATANATTFINGIQNNGQVIEARLKGVDVPVNITSRNVILDDTGAIDRNKSSNVVTYKTPDGKAKLAHIE